MNESPFFAFFSQRARRVGAMLGRIDRKLTRHTLLLGMCSSLLLAGLTAAYNLTIGPLCNLNDIGGWDNRLLFTAMTALVHALLLFALTLMNRKSALRLFLRQGITTAGFLLLLLAINQKTFAYVSGIQPVVRDMDVRGLAALQGLPDWTSNLSAPAWTLLYILTRGPVYDMYLVKLFAIACDLLLAMLVMRTADRCQTGLRAEAALTLCLILPQGFLNAACSAQIDHAAVLLLAVSLALCTGDLGGRARPLAGALCWGAAAAVSGIALYALPVYGMLILKKRMKPAHLIAGFLVPIALCIPSICAGLSAGEALLSLVRVNFGVPEFASGAPNMMNLFPRAAVEEMPGYFMLRQIPALDMTTNAQPYYTQSHMEIAMRSLALLGLAMLMGVWALVWRRGETHTLRGLLALTVGSLFVCPGATSAAWLAVDMLCVLSLLTQRTLRVPACLLLFATAGASALPVTGEVLLPMVVAMGICLVALCALLGMFDRHETR